MGSPVKHGDGANIIAIHPGTGTLKWITQVDRHPAAIITGSPVAFNNVIYVGVASYEEDLSSVPGYPCCSFRGSVVALDQATGKKLWQTFTVEPNGGATDEFSGGAVWEPPAIDASRGLLYVGTGDNYTVPSSNKNCEMSHEANGSPTLCTNPGDHFDSVVALDLKTGKIKWSTKVKEYDTWILDCLFPAPAGATHCPAPSGGDLDFTGSGPNLVGNIVGIGEKSGVYWALDPDTGAILWNTTVGPGSAAGEMWGTASDGKNIYLPISNFFHVPYKLTPNGEAISWGSWSAINAATGRIVWQTADPTSLALDTGGMSVANGVVFAGSISGNMYALNAQTGKVLWSFASGWPVVDAPSIVNGVVYWGAGYSRGTATNPGFRYGHSSAARKIYAFALAK
jgi:polyvinyl alcohol dehydrogenase (cytochrome)